ncbi:hypothetical protein AciX9_4544 (plasmid) [Granulicella tundricola MP5ACTX9]|uniref:Uncharacterized protein n=1 Tax=Granulicella tundricola (strain ATCC BAA-1859 / DSM 23138 / MP5ACTX9) TaxID=1198114 RepID=E8X7P6_GRATM|nr:hypothetical protein AciX9_4544 [Granulicella tundricola MP5ACTX9]
MMRKIILWTTVLSGAAAAYLLFKRGVPVGTIASDVLTHPIGTLIHELGNSGSTS